MVNKEITIEKLKELENDTLKLTKELEVIRGKSVSDLWLEDLKMLEKTSFFTG